MIHATISTRNPKAISEALDRDWDHNEREDGFTVLLALVATGSSFGTPMPEDDIVGLVRKVLRHGHLEDATEQGLTPLSLACEFRLWRVARLLIEAGAVVGTIDNFGITPLHRAALLGAPVDFAQLLVERGARVDAATTAYSEHHDVRRGATPVALAKRRKGKELLTFLESVPGSAPAPVNTAAFAARWLRGASVPADLAAFLALEAEGDPSLAPLEVASLALDAPVPIQVFLERNEGATRNALEVLASELDWIAAAEDGFYAYYRNAAGVTPMEAPVVFLDDEAQFSTCGRTFTEAVVARAGASHGKKLIAALRGRGVVVASPADVKKAIKKLPDISKRQRALAG